MISPYARAGAPLVAGALVLLAMARQPPSVSWDPAWGVLAAEQQLAGRTSGIREVALADPRDLAQDVRTRVSEIAPGYQAVPWALRKLGLGLGAAVSATMIALFLVGALGWARWFRRLAPDPGERAALLALFLLLPRQPFPGAYDGGEPLLWAAFPFVLEATMIAVERATTTAALAAGFLAPSLVFVKLSAGLAAIGLALFAAVELRRSRRALACYAVGAGAAAALLIAAQVPGGVSPATAGALHPRAVELLLTPFEWPTNMTGWELIYFAWPPAITTLRWITVAAAWLVLAIALRPSIITDSEITGDEQRARRATLFVLATSAIGLLFLQARGGQITVEARHLRLPALMLLPIVFHALWRALRWSHGMWRALAAICFLLWFVAPAAANAWSIAHQIATARPTVSQLAAPGLGDETPAFLAHARAFAAEGRLLFLPNPALAPELPTARLLLATGAASDESVVYRGRPRAGIAVWTPARFATDGRQQAIERRFADVHCWRTATDGAPGVWRLSCDGE